MQLYSREMRAWVDPADVFVTLYSKDTHSFWLDRQAHPLARFSVMGHAHRATALSATDALHHIEERKHSASASNSASNSGTDVPFQWRPGFVGWFDYLQDGLRPEALTGSWLEAREAVVFDHDARSIWFAGHFNDSEHFDEWVQAVMLRLALSGGQSIGYRQKKRPKLPTAITRFAHSPAEYLGLIEKAQAYIAAGDVYQVCLTNRVEFQHDLDPLAVFLRLRESNPAPYSAYVRAGERTLVCSSPEQFLMVDSEWVVSTKPIKGTRPRSADPIEDQALATALAANAKERAENLMIVDLMRNDLGKVSVPDSVRVTDLFKVEQYATVHQLVSTVQANLQPGLAISELLASTFPAGSMTGAPKIRAMQIIDELEAEPRGVYSGAVGHLATDGSLDLGMIIRSLVFEGSKVSLGVGGGITIDSDPRAELAETELKAAALLSVLDAPNPWAIDW
ncbi:MAG: hypothetical protein RJA35_728 [Actinomycetota bacterium]